MTILARRFIIACDERDVQVAAFKRVDKTVDAEDRRKWRAAVDAWDCTREGPSPFTLPVDSEYPPRVGATDTNCYRVGGMSAADVRRQLDTEEMDAIKKGDAAVHGASQTAFLVAGLQLEAAQ